MRSLRESEKLPREDDRRRERRRREKRERLTVSPKREREVLRWDYEREAMCTTGVGGSRVARVRNLGFRKDRVRERGDWRMGGKIETLKALSNSESCRTAPLYPIKIMPFYVECGLDCRFDSKSCIVSNVIIH